MASAWVALRLDGSPRSAQASDDLPGLRTVPKTFSAEDKWWEWKSSWDFCLITPSCKFNRKSSLNSDEAPSEGEENAR